MTPSELLTKTLLIMQRHIYQVEADAMKLTKEGTTRGFSATDSQVLERYAKVLLTMTKTTQDPSDDIDSMSDEELLRELEENDDHASSDES